MISQELEFVLGGSAIRVLDAFVGSPRGLNLRNIGWHGYTPLCASSQSQEDHQAQTESGNGNGGPDGIPSWLLELQKDPSGWKPLTSLLIVLLANIASAVFQTPSEESKEDALVCQETPRELDPSRFTEDTELLEEAARILEASQASREQWLPAARALLETTFSLWGRAADVSQIFTFLERFVWIFRST